TSPAPSWDSDASDEITDTDRTLDSLIPDSPSTPYDVHEVIYALCDDAEFLEIQENRAANVVIGLGRLNGQSVGFVANQPMEFAGCL
ncbi:carboxyl transferase domain-containing protein, partial [Escherichia coli]|nr:carboxyl transferase domain-containing protein [Escherichia coli]